MNHTPPKETERDLEHLAANIVHQIGDALYDSLPNDIAHEHFVKARQATNDRAIDFAKMLITKHTHSLITHAMQQIEEKRKFIWNKQNHAPDCDYVTYNRDCVCMLGADDDLTTALTILQSLLPEQNIKK